MDIDGLEPGDEVRTTEGSIVKVIRPSEDGIWILVRYVECPTSLHKVGTKDVCPAGELDEVVSRAVS